MIYCQYISKRKQIAKILFIELSWVKKAKSGFHLLSSEHLWQKYWVVWMFVAGNFSTFCIVWLTTFLNHVSSTAISAHISQIIQRFSCWKLWIYPQKFLQSDDTAISKISFLNGDKGIHNWWKSWEIKTKYGFSWRLGTLRGGGSCI